jgi:NTE family protein
MTTLSSCLDNPLIADCPRALQKLRLLVAVLLFFLGNGCAAIVHPPEPNNALDVINPKYGYRFANLKPGPNNSDSLFMVMAFSGGGTRSAALAYGVLEKLRDTPILWEGTQRRLLDEVDVINSVSGGSYAAASYGLYPDTFFTQFPERFLYADFQTELWEQYISLTGLMQLLGLSRNDRVDYLRTLIEKRLFKKKTFADLLDRRQRPLIVIHATDMTIGADFQFTQDQLDPLCTDLSTLPIARAVTASSAVPILFGPVTLKNHAGQCGYVQPSWVKRASSGLDDPTGDLRAQHRASNFMSYLDSSKTTGRPWIHLIDGGVADNLGLRGPLESGIVRGGLAPLLHRLGLKGVNKVVFLVVSAEISPDLKIDRSGEPPGTTAMASAVVDAFMNNNSFETMTWLRSNFQHWRDEAQKLAGTSTCPYAGEPDFYLIEASLRDIEDDAKREEMMAIPTTFKLAPEQVTSLIKAGRELLDNSAEFKRLVNDLQ